MLKKYMQLIIGVVTFFLFTAFLFVLLCAKLILIKLVKKAHLSVSSVFSKFISFSIALRLMSQSMVNVESIHVLLLLICNGQNRPRNFCGKASICHWKQISFLPAFSMFKTWKKKIIYKKMEKKNREKKRKFEQYERTRVRVFFKFLVSVVYGW